MIDIGYNYILIDVEKVSEKTRSGLFVPETAQVPKEKGKVILFGKDVKDLLPEIKTGSIVYTVKGYATKTPLEIDGELLYIIRDSEVLTYN